PINLFWDCVMICREPANVARMGDVYPGPSPVQRHFTAPVAASMAVSAPASLPPRNAITFAPSAIGELDVPYSCTGVVAGFRHSSLPVARSCAEKMPLTPKVKTRPLATSGVAFGPGP